jgi:hypothetical protein
MVKICALNYPKEREEEYKNYYESLSLNFGKSIEIIEIISILERKRCFK